MKEFLAYWAMVRTPSRSNYTIVILFTVCAQDSGVLDTRTLIEINEMLLDIF